ncbi:MAG TPA: IS91 family transposase [Candidatus Binatia bacterium]|nr:IS91 family transposase [Candidatus Binatia bacterium]
MDSRSLQRLLDTHYATFERTHRLPDHVREAVHCLRCCRTAALGGHVQACPDGHIERVWYNSCRHRFCPQCTQLQIAQWLEKQQARLLACDSYHVIFTIPRDLNALWLANVQVFAHVLFRAAWATVRELLADPRYLGATPGMIAALHTWGQTLVLHPHLHCLVTGGGLADDTWTAVRHGYLLPTRVVMPVFRGKLLAALRKALDQGQLALPSGVAAHQLRMLLNRLGRQKWHVQIMERYPHGRGVVTYLARYLRGGPLSPARVVAWDDQTVTFRYADNQDPDAQGRGRRKLLPLSVEDFLQRWLLHVPPPGLQVVRAYGLYAPTKRAALAQGRQALGQGPLAAPPALDWQRYCAQRGERHPECCPVCGQRLIRMAMVPPERNTRRPVLWPQAEAPPAPCPEFQEAA